MDYCNGHTHFWSDDSYSQGSYPCPGPEHCANSKLLKKQEEEKKSEDYVPRWDELPTKR